MRSRERETAMQNATPTTIVSANLGFGFFGTIRAHAEP
jgi:hypothetical protein